MVTSLGCAVGGAVKAQYRKVSGMCFRQSAPILLRPVQRFLTGRAATRARRPAAGMSRKLQHYICTALLNLVWCYLACLAAPHYLPPSHCLPPTKPEEMQLVRLFCDCMVLMFGLTMCFDVAVSRISITIVERRNISTRHIQLR